MTEQLKTRLCIAVMCACFALVGYIEHLDAVAGG